MKLKTRSLIPNMPDSADIAYLLLIFIIIMSIIGTDNLSGISLPTASSKEKASKEALRIIATKEYFIINQTEYSETAELETALRSMTSDNGVLIIADKNCQCCRIKSVLSVLDRVGITKVGFMVEE